MNLEEAFEKLKGMYPDKDVAATMTLSTTHSSYFIHVEGKCITSDTFEEAFGKLAEREKEK